MSKKDYCSSFPDYWYQWRIGKFYIPMWRKVYIGDICKDHDDEDDKRGGCDSTKFAKGLLERKIVLGLGIFSIASIACWVRYPLNMIKRV